MIVDNPSIYDLTIGELKRRPTEGDGSFVIPPTLLPVALFSKPTYYFPTGTTLQTESAIAELNSSRTNQLALTFNVLRLPPGLYELEFSIASAFNFVNLLAAPDVAFAIDPLNSLTVRVLARYAAVGSFTDYNRLRILSREQFDITVRQEATGAGQTNTVLATVNAIRIV